MPSDSLSPERPQLPPVGVTPLLIAANVLIFVLLTLSEGWQPDTDSYLRWGANYWPLTAGGEAWRLIANAFLHFGVLHLAFNMIVLGDIGRLVERLYGPLLFAAIYLSAAVAGSLSSVAWHQETVVSAGASGAVFGIYGALLAYLLRWNHALPPALVKKSLLVAGVFIVLALGYGLLHEGIDNMAHGGGLVGGFVAGLLLARPLTAGAGSLGASRRLLEGGGAVALLLGLLWIAAVPKPAYDARKELAFRRELVWFGEQEQRANAAYNDWIAQTGRGELSGRQLATRLSQHTLPEWETMAQRLGRHELEPAAPSYAVSQNLAKFAQLRRDAMGALIAALRYEDPAHLEEFKRLQAEAEALLEKTGLPEPDTNRDD